MPARTTTDGSLRSFLGELLQKLQSFSKGFLLLEREVVREVTKSSSVAVRVFVDAFGKSEVFLVVNDFWHRRFRWTLDLEPPQESVLCAFAHVCDNVVNQEGLEAFIDWASTRPGFNAKRAATRSKDPGVAREVRDLNEVVGALLHCHCHPPGLKPVLKGAKVRGDMRSAMTHLAGRGYVARVLGGAPGIIADVLAQLGLPNVHLFAMYHSAEMASLYRSQFLRLHLNSNPPEFVGASQPGQYSVGGQFFPHPTRASCIFTYEAGHTLNLGGTICTANDDDRVVFRAFNYLGDHGNVWKEYAVRPLSTSGPTSWIEGGKLDKDEWPFCPGFVRWWVEQGKLKIEYLDQASLAPVFEHDYAIVNAPGIGALSETTQAALARLENQSLLRQLEWMAKAGMRIHLEISGVEPRGALIQPFAEALRGKVRSMGLNHGELASISRLPDFYPPVLTTHAASAIYQRYEQSLHLARLLELERLYVHGNDVDLILRKGGSAGAMRSEIQADLFAKGIVVLAVLQRTIGEWKAYLDADCVVARTKDVIERAAQKLPPAGGSRVLTRALGDAKRLLGKAEAALKGGEFDTARRFADSALRRIQVTFGISKGPGRASITLSPVLMAEGFEALIEFAYDFARFQLGLGDPQATSGLTPWGERVFQRAAETGYYVAREPDGYSVAIVPVMWPELPVELNPTGAGDICSGISLVYSGW